jgi:acetyl-CoA acetyltransferase family protein
MTAASPPSTWIVDAVRTPIGRHGGALAGIRPDDLAAHALAALAARRPDLDPADIDDVWFGNANGAGEDNRNVARMALLLAGLPADIPGATVNRLCGSGMEAVVEANRAVAVGDASLAVAGGVESMSRAPWVMLKPEAPYARDHQTLHSSTLGWRMVNPRMPEEWTVSLGEGAELLADRFDISREAQDGFALESHRKAVSAWDAGRFSDESVPLLGSGHSGERSSTRFRDQKPGGDEEPFLEELLLARDESIRADTTLERLARLRPAFRPDGSVTAGNSSPLNDGAAALLLADDAGLQRVGRPPLARIVARATSAIEPQWYGIGPVEATERALARAGIGWRDLAVVELNEAFAAQALACLAHWPDLDPAIVNPNGGAIAIGHPIGCSGARIVTSLAWELHRRGGGYGLATMCIGVGQGIAVVLEG